MSSSLALMNFQSALSSAGFAQSLIFGGYRPDRQAVAFVQGDLFRLPADGFAVACLKEGSVGMNREKLLALPRIEGCNLNQQMGALNRGLVRLFREADSRNLKTLALPLGDERVFGDLGDKIVGHLILAAAGTFWDSFGTVTLSYILVAFQSQTFALEL